MYFLIFLACHHSENPSTIAGLTTLTVNTLRVMRDDFATVLRKSPRWKDQSSQKWIKNTLVYFRIKGNLTWVYRCTIEMSQNRSLLLFEIFIEGLPSVRIIFHTTMPSYILFITLPSILLLICWRITFGIWTMFQIMKTAKVASRGLERTSMKWRKCL